jgi:hypothetical protein
MASTPASMMRIVTTGLQDRERLNTYAGQPSAKFYTAVHHRRTRWASQWRRVEFDNQADFGKRATATLPVHAELITRVTLVVSLPDLYTPQRKAELAAGGTFGLRRLIGPHWSWTNGIGHALCSDAELRIGDQVVDRLDSRLLEVIDEQEGPVEHWDSKNTMIARDPSAYTQFAYEGRTPSQQRQQTVEIVFPFWFNRGPGPQALPIQALARDRVQITVNFRDLQQCVYSDARVDPRNPGFGAVGVPGQLPTMAGCGFYQTDSDGVPINNMTRVPIGVPGSLEPKGSVLPGYTMPPASALRFQDAFWVVEYVSLEDREAAALRAADLQIPIEQHVAVPVTNTGGASHVRIPLAQGGLVRDITWVAQREEATNYNAYFLFSRDLADPSIDGSVDASASFVPWWPNARLPDWDYGNGYIRPGFADRHSDPVTAASLWIRGKRRFELEGPSFFRSLIPALGSRRCPLIDRYIYRYDFGFWPTGGLEEALNLPVDQARGFANWDRLPQKELELTLDTGCGGGANSAWEVDPTQAVRTYTGGDVIGNITADFADTTAGFQIELLGAGGGPTHGRGAIVSGIVDYQAIVNGAGFNGLYARANAGGSASLFVRKTDGSVTWIAVAGAGGSGSGVGVNRGGHAASATEVAFRGGNAVRTHEPEIQPAGETVYTNEVDPYGVLVSYVGISPIFTVTAPGTVTSAEVLSAVWPGSIIVYFYKNGVEQAFAFVNYPGADIIEWHPVTPSTPFTVVPGDQLFIPHTSLFVTRLYRIAVDGSGGAIVRIKVDTEEVVLRGGGGGGRLETLGVGGPDGTSFQNTVAFAMGHVQTGGTANGQRGGDGYTGGGSGSACGGGGGSYVSRWMTGVRSVEAEEPTVATIRVTPLRAVRKPRPVFNIYAWLTTYNMLRIVGGRGALMFSA